MIPPPEAYPAPPPSRNGAFWSYQDLFLLFGLILTTIFILPFVMVLFRQTPPAYLNLAGQSIIYAVALGAMAAIFRLKYDQPLWPSLAWRRPLLYNAVVSFFMGGVVVIGLSYLAALMEAKPHDLPFEKMMINPTLVVLYGIVVVVAGPICEELVFRGFIMPVLMRSTGIVLGILITAVLFGALHSFEYADWRIVLMVTIAGATFGWRRYTTGSTIDAALMHAGFNLVPFIVLITSR